MAMSEEKKRKILIPALGVLVLFILWQGYKMFAGGSPEPAQLRGPIPHAADGAGAAPQQPGVVTTGQPGGQGPIIQTKTVVAAKVVQAQAPSLSPEEQEQLKAARKSQIEYLRILNQVQISDMQKRLIESRVGVEAARASIAKARLDRAKAISQRERIEEAATSKPNAFDNYNLVFVGRTTGRWIAVLSLNKRYLAHDMLAVAGTTGGQQQLSIGESTATDTEVFYDVFMGRSLPDGSEILSINRESVLIAHEGQRRRIILPVTSPGLLIKEVKGEETKDIPPPAAAAKLEEGKVTGAATAGAPGAAGPGA